MRSSRGSGAQQCPTSPPYLFNKRHNELLPIQARKPYLGGDAMLECCQGLDDHSLISDLSGSESTQEPKT
ncbi:hypothetical protein STEG23_003814 [Scotinomys teguina]